MIAPIRWSLLVDARGRSGADNMGIDAALLHAARRGEAFLRLYAWTPPCLSFGRNEPARRRYDADRLRALGLDVVRRPTGGRAVWHDREVTYAVAGPDTLFGSLAAGYQAIHAMLAAALEALGASVAVAGASGPAPGPGAGPCFAAPVGGELLSAGRKLVGSAQIREAGAFLQHGSLLLEDAQDMVNRVTRAPAPAPTAIGLRHAIGRDVTFDEVADTIRSAARATWPGRWDEAEAPAPDHRFADPAWTWRR